MQRNQNDMGFSDVQEPALFGNDDAGLFYKAVAARLARLYAEGHGVRELLNHGKFKKHGGDMPSWLYSLITVMNPIQGMLLATLGTAGLAGSLMSKRQGLQVVGLCLFVLGGYGFANVLGGVLPIKVN